MEFWGRGNNNDVYDNEQRLKKKSQTKYIYMHFVNNVAADFCFILKYCLPCTIDIFNYFYARIYSSCLQGTNAYFMLPLKVSIGGRRGKKLHAERGFFF